MRAKLRCSNWELGQVHPSGYAELVLRPDAVVVRCTARQTCVIKCGGVRSTVEDGKASCEGFVSGALDHEAGLVVRVIRPQHIDSGQAAAICDLSRCVEV